MKKAVQRELAIRYIRSVREADPGIGGTKLWYMYQREFGQNSPIGRDRFADIVDEYGFKIRKRVRAPRTTDSTHGLPTFPNLAADFIPTSPNQLWVSDITYIVMWHSEYSYAFCYLSLVMDAYSKMIVGWSVGRTLETAYPLEAVKMAIGRLGGSVPQGLIHHSDRGCQYASREYVKLLQSCGIRISMTESGDPKDNAQAERVNNTMKNELLKGYRFTSIEEVREAVREKVEFYNSQRPHMSVDMMTPLEASRRTGTLPKRWTSYRELAIQKASEQAHDPVESPPCPGNPSGLRPPVNPGQGLHTSSQQLSVIEQ